MRDFGGLGGLIDGRGINEADEFEMAVSRALGEQMRNDEQIASEMWSALANVDWVHDSGDTASYSFRAAGDLVAAVMGRGDYLDWYCSGPSEVVSERVRLAMLTEGWFEADD